MTLTLTLQAKWAKFLWLTGLFLVTYWMGSFILRTFIIDALTDSRIAIDGQVIEGALAYYPDSSDLHARLAETELQMAERDLEKVERHSLLAVSLSPNRYRSWVLLGMVREWRGNREGAEEALRTARALSPADTNTHWQLANLLVRSGKLPEAIDYFRVVGKEDSSLLPAIYDLVWQYSGGDVKMMREVAGEDPQSLSTLAFALLQVAEPDAAMQAFESIDRNAQLPTGLGAEFVNALIAENRLQEARRVWRHVQAADPASEAESSQIWNPGFESEESSGLNQFDWLLQPSDYAQIVIVNGTAHSGSRSLRVTFTGRDTLRLDKEVNQLVLVRPGVRYRLECFVKCRDFSSPEGPRLVVKKRDAADWLAASEPVVARTNDWQQLVVEFVAPDEKAEKKDDEKAINAVPLLIGLKRKPKYSFDEPTRGTLWLDDFKLTEVRKN